jgi:thymidylate synthase (FAD)
MSDVKLVWVTPDAEKHIAYCARVSSPNQDNPEYAKLIAYLIKNRHWSPLEMASMCIEINTTRAISPQILRHRSFSFQEFSLRYSEATTFETYNARRQDDKNRQNSIDDLEDSVKQWFINAQNRTQDQAMAAYDQALQFGIAKELARNLLPMSTSTKLYMSGTIRSWITYLMVRLEPGTQKEHRDIAEQIYKILKTECPIITLVLQELYPETFK